VLDHCGSTASIQSAVSVRLATQMWDGDSLLPVGEAFVSLTGLLRQKEKRVSVTREFDVTSRHTSVPGFGIGNVAENDARCHIGKLMVRDLLWCIEPWLWRLCLRFFVRSLSCPVSEGKVKGLCSPDLVPFCLPARELRWVGRPRSLMRSCEPPCVTRLQHRFIQRSCSRCSADRTRTSRFAVALYLAHVDWRRSGIVPCSVSRRKRRVKVTAHRLTEDNRPLSEVLQSQITAVKSGEKGVCD
jgi:hypothetical protein